MGMFDYYVPVPVLACPRCCAPLGAWQGKGGPCALLTWTQHERRPTQHDLAKEACLADGGTTIYTECAACGVWVNAECAIVGGLWVETRTTSPLAED